ncbi:hypothetical protein CRENBAI_020735 [Crenichthys baileyi]|uniref:Uncharacterized protein n=1 Tax=Crenichthys baileyi TaxID=28760 RepID=A0AAV9RCV1_9TELE
MPDMDFMDNHGVLPVESRKRHRRRRPWVHVILQGREQFGEYHHLLQEQRPSSKICCPALGHESASGTPTTGDRSEASPKPDTGHSSSAEPAASSPWPIRFRHPDFG